MPPNMPALRPSVGRRWVGNEVVLYVDVEMSEMNVRRYAEDTSVLKQKRVFMFSDDHARN
jgi:hypothetical protein